MTASDPQGSVHFEQRQPEHLARHRFGMQSADFLVCRNCGAYIGVCCRIDEQRFAVIDARAL